MSRLSRLATSAVGALVVFASLSLSAEESCPSAASLLGAWTARGTEIQARFQSDRVVLREKGLLDAASILRREPCKLVVRDQGLLSTWTLTGDEKGLRLDRGKDTIILDRLPQIPPSLDISALPLPPPGPVPPDKVKEIAQELTTREDRDQATATKASEKDKRQTVLAENISYLREVVNHYGWIDIPRFGKPAAAAAILIVKHADDVPLMQAALPIVERDAKENGGGKELVSILVDEVLITTGHKQKYGTQISVDENGKPFIVPVEDPGKVDEYRKALGIPPWSDYLKKASQALFQGAPIRIPGPDE